MSYKEYNKRYSPKANNERFPAKRDNAYTAACYCRLSRDDENDGTSVSIETQKKVLEDYCQTNGYDVYDFYCDNGFTDTNFDRPSFKKMMSEASDGAFNMIVVKDLPFRTQLH